MSYESIQVVDRELRAVVGDAQFTDLLRNSELKVSATYRWDENGKLVIQTFDWRIQPPEGMPRKDWLKFFPVGPELDIELERIQKQEQIIADCKAVTASLDVFIKTGDAALAKLAAARERLSGEPKGGDATE